MTHMSWHPGPDPKKHPLAWAPLCGVRRLPWAITPHLSDIDCVECAKILWSGVFDGFISDRTVR
jgi:hypothetical protein